ncbi:MAG TPA: hypothetical protein VG873_16945 [Burkholderiales bacterium]|nr:hypothetical protein [Burkholderiales bacterium]
MKVQSSSKPVEQVVAAIQTLDLEPIKFKLMDADEGEGWSRETVDRLEVEYKRFLTLLVKYPDTVIAPSKEVDAFWHGHILDTMKYAEDCENVFGYFLHHFPYFGMRDANDAAAQAEAAAATHALLAKEFGAAQDTKAAYCYAAVKADAAYCYAAVKADAAYCYAAKPANAAYCYAAKKADAAYCYAAKPASAAYCYAAKPLTQAAYCYATKPAANAATAYCYAAKPVQAAYCYAAKKADAAYCYAAKPAAVTPKTFDFSRPTLALAA